MFIGKEEIIVLCDLSSLQADLYQYVLKLPDFENAKYGAHLCDCGGAKKAVNSRNSNSNSTVKNKDTIDKKGGKNKELPKLRKNCCRKYCVPIARSNGQESNGFVFIFLY